MDVIADFSFHLPMILIAESLGVRPDDRMQFRHWLEAIELFLSVGRAIPERARAATEGADAIERYLQGIIDERRAHPRDDLISALVTADEDGTRFTDEEVMGTATFLLMAGHDTTMTLIAAAVHALLTHPDEMARLRADETLLDSAIEEILRYESVANRWTRFAIADTTIGDARITAGQRVLFCLAAANHDPAVFTDPHRFDVTRNPQRHIAFGHGPHYCLGALLARMELRSALHALLTLPNLRLAPGPLVRRKTLTIRAFERLPVLWDPPR
jgi:cytochrome P450